MRKVTVPEDMSSEQKAILGVVSKRQVIYILIGGSIVYSYVPFVYRLFSNINIFASLIACLISAVPMGLIVGLLGFYKKANRHMFFDKYLITKLGYKYQIGVWRKGSHVHDWMMEDME